jgi:predicted Zn-dependent peptidase
LHEELYEEGLIDQSFSYDYTQEQGFGFALIGGDSAKPDELMESLFGILQKSKAGTGLNEESLQRTIKKKIGSFLRSLNSPEYIANQFTRYAFNDMNLFDVVSVLEKLTIEDIREVAKDLISDERMTVCQVLPK